MAVLAGTFRDHAAVQSCSSYPTCACVSALDSVRSARMIYSLNTRMYVVRLILRLTIVDYHYRTTQIFICAMYNRLYILHEEIYELDTLGHGRFSSILSLPSAAIIFLVGASYSYLRLLASLQRK